MIELDLRGEKCPDTFVFTKIKAEELREQGKRGEVLKVIVDYEPSAKNVPRSIAEEGHRVLKVEKKEGYWEIYIEIR